MYASRLYLAGETTKQRFKSDAVCVSHFMSSFWTLWARKRLIPQRNVLSKPRAHQEEKRVASMLFDVLRIVTTLYGDTGDVNNWSETRSALMAVHSPHEKSSWESLQRLMPCGLMSDADVNGEALVRERLELFVYNGVLRSGQRWAERFRTVSKASVCVNNNPTVDFTRVKLHFQMLSCFQTNFSDTKLLLKWKHHVLYWDSLAFQPSKLFRSVGMPANLFHFLSHAVLLMEKNKV